MDGQTHLPRSQATTGSFSASPLRAQCLHLAISSISRSACEGGRGAYVMCEGGGKDGISMWCVRMKQGVQCMYVCEM